VSDFDAAERSELLFRAVNERILEIGANDVEALEILCECGDESCISTVVITGRDYERLRLDSSRFVSAKATSWPTSSASPSARQSTSWSRRPDERPRWSCAASPTGPFPSRRGSEPGRPRPPAAP